MALPNNLFSEVTAVRFLELYNYNCCPKLNLNYRRRELYTEKINNAGRETTSQQIEEWAQTINEMKRLINYHKFIYVHVLIFPFIIFNFKFYFFFYQNYPF